MTLRERRARIGRIYRLRRTQYRSLSLRFLDQISRCKSEAARRLILGVSRKGEI